MCNWTHESNMTTDKNKQANARVTIGSIMAEVLGLESYIDGKAHPEVELTLYAEMVDLTDLEHATSKEEHEQWRLPELEDCPTRARIRGVNNRRWILTTKTKPNTSAEGCIEVENDISKDMFESLKKMGSDGYYKTRYFFPIPNTGLVWEVDVFRDISGNNHPWVKLDLEVPSSDVDLPPWPFKLRDFVIDGSSDMRSKSIINKLWGEDWSRIDDRPIK